MKKVSLPISKSIANRLLVLQARAGVPLMKIGDDAPDDVHILHDALAQLTQKEATDNLLVIDVDNCGTAMRFLTAYCALADRPAVLTGCPRMLQRPVGQLVDALRTIGARLEYMGEQGFPPLRILPKETPFPNVLRVVLNHPQSTQFVSALLLMGVEVETDSRSPYIEMTKHCIKDFSVPDAHPSVPVERDWSSAAFWYEWVALHGGELLLQDLPEQTLQGDKIVADLFLPLGVSTTFTAEGALIKKDRPAMHDIPLVNFSSCPDLYPALAITCERLGIPLQAIGTDSLHIKESDRLQAVAEHKTYGDHRIAMSLLAADLPCDDTACIAKSYPAFLSQLRALNNRKSHITPVVPRRGINDEGKGKKHALYRLISKAATDYVWLMDDDITPPPFHGGQGGVFPVCREGQEEPAPDLLILPLRMQAEQGCTPNLLERLQIAEYAAIQGLTILSAKYGHPVLCSSANLIVRRDRWLESYPDLHSELASGDDMFLLESFKRRGLRIAVSEDENLTAVVRPVPTWRAFFRQRMRWAGKAPAYHDRDIILCGAAVLVANILQLLCPPVLLIKFPVEYALIRTREPDTSVWIALLLELVYPFYLLFSLLGGIFTTSRSTSRSF
ncbi:MAG: hypothetical protein ACI4BD_01160 [Paludibacteraceae bacterium]